MNTIPVYFYTEAAIENQFFSFICRHCERQLGADYIMPNTKSRYENLCITCAQEMRAIAHEDMKAIREALVLEALSRDMRMHS